MSDSGENEWPKKRKRKTLKRTLIKQDKVAGRAHVNHVGNIVCKRVTGPDCR